MSFFVFSRDKYPSIGASATVNIAEIKSVHNGTVGNDWTLVITNKDNSSITPWFTKGEDVIRAFKDLNEELAKFSKTKSDSVIIKDVYTNESHTVKINEKQNMNFFEFNKYKYPSLLVDEAVNLDSVYNFYKSEPEVGSGRFQLKIRTANSDYTYIKFVKSEDLDTAYQDLYEACIKNKSNTQTKTENKMSSMNNTLNTIATDIKDFIKEHRQVIYYIVLGLLIDHFFLNGQFTTKIKNIVQNLLDKAEEKITSKKTDGKVVDV